MTPINETTIQVLYAIIVAQLALTATAVTNFHCLTTVPDAIDVLQEINYNAQMPQP